MFDRTTTFVPQPASRFVLLAAVLGLAQADGSRDADAQIITSTWDGANDNWSNAAHWNSTSFPNNGNGGFDYVANIGSGTVTLNTSVSINGLNLTGGTLTGGQDLTVTDVLLNGGTLAGNGALNATNVTLTSGQLARSLTLPVGGSNTIQGIQVGSGFTLTNPAGATLTAPVPGPGEKESDGPGTFVNAGTFVKTGGARYYLGMPFTNNGLIEVQNNNLRLTSTGVNNGQADVQAGAQLEIAGTQTFNPGSSITGAGTLLLLSGTTTVNGSLSVNTLALQGGTLAGSGALNPTNVTLTSGQLALSLTLPVGGANTIQGIQVASGFTLTNPAGATLTAPVPGPGEKESDGPGTLVNAGTFVKTGGARYYLSMPFTNNGLIEVQNNNLRLTSTGVNNGQADVQAGAQLEIAGTQTFNPGSSITGAGNLLVLAPGIATIAGDDSHTGGTTISGGTLQIGSGGATGTLGNGPVTNNGSLVFNRSDTYTAAQAISGAGSLTQCGAGTLTLSGSNTYTGGTSINAGGLVVAGSLGNTAVTVGGGARLGGTGSIGGTVVVLGGSTAGTQGAVNLADGMIGTLTLSDPNAADTVLTLGGLTVGNPSAFTFEVGAIADRIQVAAGKVLVNPGGSLINVIALSGFGPGTYDLMDFPNGQASGLGYLSLVTTTLPGFTLSLQQTPTSEQLVVQSVPEPSTLALLGAAAAGLAAWGWRRSRNLGMMCLVAHL
ncbi:MAG: autotransporter-associated beta strand repeat-containing protein [Thermoguttaceae bacterium]|jgi:autotransporter-associated beta strand protein